MGGYRGWVSRVGRGCMCAFERCQVRKVGGCVPLFVKDIRIKKQGCAMKKRILMYLWYVCRSGRR